MSPTTTSSMGISVCGASLRVTAMVFSTNSESFCAAWSPRNSWIKVISPLNKIITRMISTVLKSRWPWGIME